MLKDACCCIAVEFLGGVEVNLCLKLWPLVEARASEKDNLCLYALKLCSRGLRWGAVEIPNVQVEVGLPSPAITVAV